MYALKDKLATIHLLNDFQFYRPEIFTLEGAFVIGFYFTIYAFFGWLLENTYSLFTRSVFFKDGFFWGPFKPMYGIAPVLLIFLVKSHMNGLLVLLICFFVPTIVEYVSGVLLQKLFQRQWWDYSDHHLQLHGHICLSFSLCWLALSVIGLIYLHPTIEMTYGMLEQWWGFLFPVVTIYFLAELFMAIRRHREPKPLIIKSSNIIR